MHRVSYRDQRKIAVELEPSLSAPEPTRLPEPIDVAGNPIFGERDY